MANTRPGLFGRKLGMTQIFDTNGDVCPVTVIDTAGNAVMALRSATGKDGYDAAQLGFGSRRESRNNKPLNGIFAQAGVTPRLHIREVRLTATDLGRYPVGAELAVADFFKTGQKIDITGQSKGKGFAGVMKRHNFKGFIRSHGTHEYFRHGGSIGTRLTPGMTLKGKKMPGHMGAAQVTVQNLTVVRVDAERGLVFVRGGIPGANGSVLLLRAAAKG